MNASVIVPLGLVASIAIGGILTLAAIVILLRGGKQRWFAACIAILGALTVNLWWIAFLFMAAYKLFILKEDT